MRRVVPLIAVLLVGFAPAPFPRPSKHYVATRELIGAWRIITLHRTTDKEVTGLKEVKPPVQIVNISPTRWVFGEGRLGIDRRRDFDFRINHAKRFTEIDFMELGEKVPTGRGIIELRGATLRIIYTWGKRPTGFKNQPPNCFVITLKRQ